MKITKYAALNPAIGEYEFATTQEELKQLIAKNALAFYMTHCHGVLHSIVEIDENGWETWTSSNNISVELTNKLLQEIAANVKL